MKNEPGNPFPDFAERMLIFMMNVRKSMPPEKHMDSVEELLRSIAFGNPPGSERWDENLPPITQADIDDALANPNPGEIERIIARMADPKVMSV